MKTIQPSFKEEVRYALDYLKINFRLEEKAPLDAFFEIAVRKNKKRFFLFVSKILGKHLAINPRVGILGGMLLAEEYAHEILGIPYTIKEQLLEALTDSKILDEQFETLMKETYDLERQTLFIGFAETATGLGHSMFRSFTGNGTYIHTTREAITTMKPSFTFEEEHSHATGHKCYTEREDFFANFETIVLVDDEITTGNTALNLIKAFHEKSRAKRYVVISLLDWRSEMHKEKAKQVEEELGVTITFVAPIKGCIEAEVLKPLEEKVFERENVIGEIKEIGEINKIAIKEEDREHSGRANQPTNDQQLKIGDTVRLDFEKYKRLTTKAEDGKERNLAYMEATGRFGIDCSQNKYYESHLEILGKDLAALRGYEKCLCIGSEEFIALPMYLAYSLEKQSGLPVVYQSTTRSPIIVKEEEGYPITHAVAYKRPEDQTVVNYLYNIAPGRYDEVFWFFERDVEEGFKVQMAKVFEQQGVKKLHFVVCDGNEEAI